MKADVRKHSEFLDHAIAVEYEQDMLHAAMTKLRTPPATLTDPECAALRRWIKAAKKKHPRGRPPGPNAVDIALYCSLREDFGMPIKAAVAETVTLFGVSRSVVYAARRKLVSE
jgi:hypothetical protein